MSGSSSSSSSASCAACKFLRRRCLAGCVFAPHFPADEPRKFAQVHRVYGTSNAARLLGRLSPSRREDAASSLAFEAEARLLDPVYGCVGYIWLLQHRIEQAEAELRRTELQLSACRARAAARSPPLAGHDHQGRVLWLQQQAAAAAAAAAQQSGSGVGGEDERSGLGYSSSIFF